MNGSVKTTLTGVGVIFGLQLIMAIIIKVYVASLSESQPGALTAGAQFGYLLLGVSLATFFVGGLIVGFMVEHVALGVPVIVALLAMAVTSLVSVLFSLPDNLFLLAYSRTSDWLSFFITLAGGVVITVAGGLVGERFRTPVNDDPLARWVVVVSLAFVLTGPFYFLLPYGLPWYIAVIATLIIMVLVGVGYYLFREGPTFEESIEEVSISPERQE